MSLLSDMVINISPITDICIMPDFKYALNSSQWHLSKQTHVVHGVYCCTEDSFLTKMG
jgi:hypothetical protein